MRNALTPLYAAESRILIVFSRSARNTVSLTVDGSGPPLSENGTSVKSREIRDLDRRTLKAAENAVPYQRTSLPGSFRVPRLRQYRRGSSPVARSGTGKEDQKCDKYGACAGTSPPAQSLSPPCFSYLLYSSSGRFSSACRLPVTVGSSLPCFPASRPRAVVTCVEQETAWRKSVLDTSAMMPYLLRAVGFRKAAVPPLCRRRHTSPCGVHVLTLHTSRSPARRRPGLAAGVHFLENDANGFFGGRAVEGDNGHTVIFEVFENLALERAELFPNRLVLVARQCLSKPSCHLSQSNTWDTGYIRAAYSCSGVERSSSTSARILFGRSIFWHADDRLLAIGFWSSAFGYRYKTSV